jgi:hypothetical protein
VLVALGERSQLAIHLVTIEALGIESIVHPETLDGLDESSNVADRFSHRLLWLRVRESREAFADVEPLGQRRVT